ncbi:MAG: UDP-N-acetylmuramate--L-alanine ligase, partial [Candidatus Kapaibacterium sp.]
MYTSVKHIHFVGIGGIGMSGIAEILLSQGFTVSGSDVARSETTEALTGLGAVIMIGHRAENVKGADVVVYSSAVRPSENAETVAAHAARIPVIRRAEMLADVARLKYCLAVSGTHGKTTTTSMCGLVLMAGGLDPTVIVGGRLRGLGGSNARLGQGQWTVLEADEYDRSFLQLSPTIAIVTNVEAEHLDIYKDYEDVRQTFLQFLGRLPFYGLIVACADDLGVQSLLPHMNKPVITYGTDASADVRAVDCVFEGRTSSFTVLHKGQVMGPVVLDIPGMHNVRNALAAIAVAIRLGIDMNVITATLREFHGVLRRFEILGEKGDVMVVQDYAHHHTEVRATLESARAGWKRRIVAVFQPHTYTRTRDFATEFGAAFDAADVVFVTDVYAARENPVPGVSGETIVDAIRKHGHPDVRYVPSVGDI